MWVRSILLLVYQLNLFVQLTPPTTGCLKNKHTLRTWRFSQHDNENWHQRLCLHSVKYCGNCLSMLGFPTFLHLLAPPGRPRHPPTETDGTLDTDDDLQTLHYLLGILPKKIIAIFWRFLAKWEFFHEKTFGSSYVDFTTYGRRGF